MNSDNGALEFNAYFNNERLNSTSKEAEKRVQGFSDAAVKAGEKIDDAFNITSENIRIQKDVIGQIEGQLNNLNIEISKMKPGDAQSKMKQDAAQVAAELKAEKDALKQLEQQVKSTEQAHTSFRSRLREMKEQLIQMEMAGLRNTDAYKKLQTEAGELADAMGDAQRQIKAMGNDEKIFHGIASTVSGLTGAMSAAQGAVGLFAGENEDLNRIMLKVQSMMAITIGLQQVEETLNKDSYFSIVILAKGKEMLAAAELKVATAMGVSTVAARVLMATMTLGLSIAITAAIVVMEKFISKQAEASKQQEELNKKITESAFEPVSAIHQLATEYLALGDNIKAKDKFIEDNSDKFKDLGVAVNNVKDAENLLIENKDKFIESLILKAKAMAVSELAASKYKEAINKQLELEKETPTKAVNHTYINPQSGMSSSWQTTEKNSNYDELKTEKDKLETEGADLFKMAAEFTEQEKAILKGIGVSNNKIVAGSISALEVSISKLQEKYKSATSESERNLILKDIKAQQALVDKMDKSKDKAKDTKAGKEDKHKEDLKKYGDDLKEQLDLADNVIKKMDVLGQKRKELEGDKSELGKSKAGILSESEKDVTKETRVQTNKLIEDYASALDRKKKLFKDYTNDTILMQKKLDEATTPEEKSKINGAITKRAIKYSKDSKTSGDSEYDSLLTDYKTFEQKKQAIIDDYDEKRRKAKEFGNAVLVGELNKAQTKEVSELSLSELQNSPAFVELFSNLDNLTVKKMSELRDKLEVAWSKLNLSPEALSSLRDQMDKVEEKIRTKNPFKALSEDVKKYKDDQSSVNLKTVFKDASAGMDLLKGAFDSVVGGIQKMGVNMDEGDQKVMADISGMMQGASDLAMGIATGNPLQIIQGSIELITNGIDLIAGSKDRKLERSITRHKDEVEKLKRSYEDLDRAVDKALGSDRYSSQKATIDNLKKQQREYAAMVQAERDKKKTDSKKVQEYQDSVKDASNKIADSINSIKEDILGTSVSSAASDLGSALIDAFAAGTDAAKAWGDKVNDIVGNVVKKMLVQKLVEEPVGKIINKYMAKWVDSSGNFIGFDAVMGSAQDMGKELSALGPGLSKLMEGLPDDIKKYLVGDSTTSKTAMAGEIKGITSEESGVLGGQMNAIRINQIDSISVLRNSLIALDKIAENTMYNRFLESIDNRLYSMQNSDILRSKGI